MCVCVCVCVCACACACACACVCVCAIHEASMVLPVLPNIEGPCLLCVYLVCGGGDCVVCLCVCVFVCICVYVCVCHVCVWGGGGSHRATSSW